MYVAAYSLAEAGRLLCKADGQPIHGIDREIRDYFSDRWGKPMDGVTPERGVWVQQTRNTPPIRVI